MIHWPILNRKEALDAMKARGETVEAELSRVRNIQVDTQPLPDFVDTLFDFSIGQLKAESEWIKRTLDYMNTKPWLD